MMQTRHRRSGFTLIEVILAIALTALSIGVAASALTTATNVRERVLQHRETLEQNVRFRTTLIDMLRHAPNADAIDEPLMRVSQAADGGVQLVFLSTGVRAPYGIGDAWRVTVTGTSSGVTLDAVPVVSPTNGPVLHTVFRPTVTEGRVLHVRFLEPASNRNAPRWRDDWPLERTRPSAVSLRFSDNVTSALLLVELNPLQLAVRP